MVYPEECKHFEEVAHEEYILLFSWYRLLLSVFATVFGVIVSLGYVPKESTAEYSQLSRFCLFAAELSLAVSIGFLIYLCYNYSAGYGRKYRIEYLNKLLQAMKEVERKGMAEIVLPKIKFEKTCEWAVYICIALSLIFLLIYAYVQIFIG
jgi:hypothetical protein